MNAISELHNEYDLDETCVVNGMVNQLCFTKPMP